MVEKEIIEKIEKIIEEIGGSSLVHMFFHNFKFMQWLRPGGSSHQINRESD